VAELALLDELLSEARAGAPVTVLVCGEAGVGKTRFLGEVTAAARDRGTRTLAGSCAALRGGAGFAFAPFAEALRPLAAELMGGGRGTTGDVAPQLARLVAMSVDVAAPPDRPELDPLGPQAQLGLVEEVLDTLERAAAPGGLLVAIEDLHWADASSRGLFDFLSRNLHGTPVMLVGTVRTDEPSHADFQTRLAEVQRGPRATRVDLEPFGRDELSELVAGVLGRPPSAELAGRVYERSAGNAFLAEELVASNALGRAGVPASVRSLVLARMAGLTAPARDVLCLAAVAGVQVSHDLLSAAGGLTDDELLAVVRELAENHLLVANRSIDGYAFRHALTREAVYDDLLPGERRRLHRNLAQALADEPALGPPARWAVTETLAEHWFAAGEPEPALAGSVAAAHAAQDVLAVADALAHYERALDLWDRVSDAERTAGIARPQLLEQAAEAASGAGDPDLAARYVDAALEELEGSTAASTRRGLLYERRSWYLGWAGRLPESEESARRAAALVPPEPPTPERARALATHALVLVLGGRRYEEATPVATAAVEAARRAGSRKEEAHARNFLGSCLVMTSTDPEAAIHESELALAISRELGDVGEVVLASSNLADSLNRLGQHERAAAVGLEGAEVGNAVAGPAQRGGVEPGQRRRRPVPRRPLGRVRASARTSTPPPGRPVRGCLGACAHGPAPGLPRNRRCRGGGHRGRRGER
jgi:tetratricopeptide (TPR) repeat protein